ncbi:P-loop containing nucleoside triphosphate hydrolase protein [Poronia punctata]|nr:P-loop containing nucleoside triphosphate hydrolase protein [Poronia punctata]
MPPAEPRRRRSRTIYEQDDVAEASPSTSDLSKRRRTGLVHRSHGDQETAEMSDESPEYSRKIKRDSSTNGLGSSADQHDPGAIVRVRVENFVTYKNAEFLPGPNLNMVIGPNGTGKSSLVCAICLGLGYHPKHLGRASHVGEFVKHGEDSAIIEVELQKRPRDRANHVIRVQINREDNGRRWWLNGRESSHKAIQELTRLLRIQIDNLCQFLPQDKVAEFAGLTPTRLLEETLRAAAPEEVLEWQMRLKTLYKEHSELKTQVEASSDTLKNLESRQQGLQADVDRLREREAIRQKVTDLKGARAVAEYDDKRHRYTAAKQRGKDTRKKLEDLQRACEPALEAVQQKQAYRAQIEPVIQERKRGLHNAEAAGEQALRRIDEMEDKMKQEASAAEAQDKALKTLKGVIGTKRAKLRELEAKLKDKPPEFTPSDWNVKIRQQENRLQEMEGERRTLSERFAELKDRNAAKTGALVRLQKNAENLTSQQGKKLTQLRNTHADAAKGWEWLQDNQDQFDKEVFGPPLLSCSVTDTRYSDHIQALLAQDDFVCFTCQSPNDHKKLSNQFYRVMGISVSIRTCASNYASFQPPIPKSRLRDLGLDAYAIDFLEGPEPVLAMLCAEKKLHTSGVALADISDAQYEQLVGTERIGAWATGGRVYRVSRRREYGPGATSTAAKTFRNGRFWTDQPVDEAERAEIERQIADIQSEINETKHEARELRAQKDQISEREKEVQAEIESLKLQKSELQKAATQYATLGDKIALVKSELESHGKEVAATRERASEHRARSDEVMLEKAHAVLQHKDVLPRIRDAHQALLDAQIRLIEAESDVKMLEERNKDIVRLLDEVKNEIHQMKGECEQLKEDARAAKDKVGDAINHNQDRLAYLTELTQGKTVDDLDDEIGAEESKLEYIHAVDPMVLRQFKKRAQEIQNLTQQKEGLAARFDSLTRKIQELREKWEPQVDALVSRINDAFAYNFEQINCAGQVDIHKDENDFEQWAIEIKVKFRQNETLQQLNQHRQSGGERAVSTIFYLMALQSMAQAPFRVVDEINQGMDPRNERMVHERMVEIACREHTSQYFLITPKLLTGLRYDPRMRVLCIASGEHMPTEGGKLDFSKLVSIQRAVKAAA